MWIRIALNTNQVIFRKNPLCFFFFILTCHAYSHSQLLTVLLRLSYPRLATDQSPAISKQKLPKVDCPKAKRPSKLPLGICLGMLVMDRNQTSAKTQARMKMFVYLFLFTQKRTLRISSRTKGKNKSTPRGLEPSDLQNAKEKNMFATLAESASTGFQ